MSGRCVKSVLLAAAVLFFGGCISQQTCGTEVDYVCGSDGATYQNPCLASQAGAKIAYKGMCQSNATMPETLCTDSDGGKNLLQKGEARQGSQPPASDFCIGNSTVQENYCVGGELKVETLPCPPGMVCEMGACTGDICNDSDGGRDLRAKGTATKGGLNSTDSCQGKGQVLEYYCGAGNEIMNYSGECAAGEECTDGACKAAESCSESDGDNDIYEKGTAITSAGTYTDYCVSETVLREYRCSGAALAIADVSCGSSFECINGACEPLLCTDSDGGRVKGEYGVVRKGGAEYNDSCIGAAAVREHYCEGGMPLSADMECGGDEVCVAGRCVAAGCFDSDGGSVAVTSGTVTIGDLTRSDECTNLTILKEYYCDGGDYMSASIDCYSHYGGGVRAVCWSGRCAQTYCMDSDGGRNENETGSASMTTTTGYASYLSDYCLDTRSVFEHHCDGNWLVSEKITCSPEQYCHMSRCVESICSDSDGGLDYLEYGAVSKGLRIEQDECLDGTMLREWRCNGNAVEYEDHACPAGCDIAGRRCVPL